MARQQSDRCLLDLGHEEIINLGDVSDSIASKTWQARSRARVAAPQTFGYSAWCLRGLASTPLEAHARPGAQVRQPVACDGPLSTSARFPYLPTRT